MLNPASKGTLKRRINQAQSQKNKKYQGGKKKFKPKKFKNRRKDQ